MNYKFKCKECDNMETKMEKEEFSKYDLIKAILASNLAEDVKEALVNSLISSRQPQPLYYGLTNIDGCAIRSPN
jgi:hypothetical protein